jgi:hypothetical protein
MEDLEKNTAIAVMWMADENAKRESNSAAIRKHAVTSTLVRQVLQTVPAWDGSMVEAGDHTASASFTRASGERRVVRVKPDLKKAEGLMRSPRLFKAWRPPRYFFLSTTLSTATPLTQPNPQTTATMNDIWLDTSTPTPSSTPSTPSSQPPPSPLTDRQARLIGTYMSTKDAVTDFMNTVLDLQIKLAREADLAEQYLEEPRDLLCQAEEGLIEHRALMRRKERGIEEEEARLRKVGTRAAREQLAEIAFFMGRTKTGVLLR